MTGRLLRRGPGGGAPVGPVQTPPAVAVLCGHAPPFAVGAALATGLRSGAGAGAAVVAVLPGSAGEQAPGLLAPPRAEARRLAASLGLRGTAAVGGGRLVLARLAESPHAGVAEAHRVVSATGTAPVVLVLAGVREAVHDELLAACDAVVAVIAGTGSEPLGALAHAAGVDHVVALEVPAVARSLAGAGVPLLAPLRALGAELAAVRR